MVDSKKSATIIILISVVVSLLFWWFGDAFSIWSKTSNPLLVMCIAILLNPAYLILIWYLFKQYQWRGLFSGLIIAISVDVASLPHSLMRSGLMPTDSSLYAYSDTTIGKLIIPILHANPFTTFILYVIIPVALILISLMIIHKTTSFVKIFKESL